MRMGIFLSSDEVQHKGHDNESGGEPRRGLRKLFVPGLGLALGEEGLGAAGDRTGETGALSALHKNNHGNGKAGEKLEDCKNDLNSRHVFQSFRVLRFYNI